MIDDVARSPDRRRDRPVCAGQGPLAVARVVIAGLAALLMAAAVGSGFGLAIAKARQAGAPSLENPWSSESARPAR